MNHPVKHAHAALDIADSAPTHTKAETASGRSLSEALSTFHAHVRVARKPYNAREL